jgi:hypothetical protein
MAQPINNLVLSDLVQKYDDPHRSRYVDKVLSNGLKHDPYLLPDTLFTLCQELSSDSLADFQYPDLYEYLVHTTSAYTKSAMRSYKSLEAYKYFVAGFVAALRQHKVNDTSLLVMAKVSNFFLKINLIKIYFSAFLFHFVGYDEVSSIVFYMYI